jgi:hypothetical protein
MALVCGRFGGRIQPVWVLRGIRRANQRFERWVRGGPFWRRGLLPTLIAISVGIIDAARDHSSLWVGASAGLCGAAVVWALVGVHLLVQRHYRAKRLATTVSLEKPPLTGA